MAIIIIMVVVGYRTLLAILFLSIVNIEIAEARNINPGEKSMPPALALSLSLLNCGSLDKHI